MNKPGRNDPCPCGSGRKYKRCCLGHEAERDAFAARLETSALPLLSRLAKFAESAARQQLEAVARKEFPFWYPPLDRAQAARIVDYLMFDARLEHIGRTAIEQFVLEQSHQLGAEEGELLDGWSQSPRRLYRVTGWSGGFLECADALAEDASKISVWSLGRGAGVIADGAPVALRALKAAGAHLCIGWPTTYGDRSVQDVAQGVRARHLDYVRSQRITGLDEFLRLQPKALDEEAAASTRASSIIVPGIR